MSTILLLDGNFLCHRARHTTNHLEYNGKRIGVLFGFLKELETLTGLHLPSKIVFAFDHSGTGIRGELYPDYKISRRSKVFTEEEKDDYISFQQQVEKLRGKILPTMGYKNIFQMRGYEADDIIAHFAERIPADDFGLIITADDDMWQCLSDNVAWYNPISKKTVTNKSFVEKWGICPAMWANVKAMAGCKTDDIEGIKGIGPVYASKWFANTLKKESKQFKLIDENLAVHNRNIGLTRLPLEGLVLPEMIEDETTEKSIMDVHISLGMRHRRQARKKFTGFDL